MSKAAVRAYVRIARELGYDKVCKDVFKRIAHASSESEVEHLFVMCRHLLPN